MNISIIGTGYVGLVAGVCFAKKGNNVLCVDVIQEKVDKINNRFAPIYEHGLPELLKQVVESGHLSATTDLKNAVINSQITFIAVGTPPREDGSANLDYIYEAARGIAEAIKSKNSYHVVVVKSTVSPGTTRSLIPIIEQGSGKKHGVDFGVAMNPEFLKEGVAIDDFMYPDRVVVGSTDKKALEILTEVYKPFTQNIVKMSTPDTAEMVKYSSNALLATKISFVNEIGDLCKRLGIDVYEVMKAVGMDHRIGPHFLEAHAFQKMSMH